MKKKWIVTLAAAGLLLSTTAGAYAGANLEAIKAFFDKDIKFTVNGESFKLVNAKGVPTYPIIHNSTVYLPVRAISDAMGVAVSYDSKTKTVALGEKVNGTPIAKGFDDMYHKKDPQVTTFEGKDYKEVYFNDATGNRAGNFMLYPKGKYQKLYLQVAAIGEDIEAIQIFNADKNQIELKKESISVEDGLKTIIVDIAGVQELYISADLKNGGKMFVPLTTSYYK